MGSAELQVRRYVDMWAAPGLHPTNIDLLQQLKTADTHHFTKNMDVIGTVSEQDRAAGTWQRTHLLGVRTDVWSPDRAELDSTLERVKQDRRRELRKGTKRPEELDAEVENCAVMQMSADDLLKQRLVLKLFRTTGSRVRWCGTIEEITTTEVQNSMGSRRALLSMAVMLPRTKTVTHVQQNHRTFRIPSLFTFCFHDAKQMWYLMVKRHWFSIGSDYDVLANGKSLGKIDGKLATLGSDSYVNLRPHELSGRTPFADILTLFAATVGYHRAMRRNIRRLVKAVSRAQSAAHVIDNEELRLRHNGRAAA